MHQIQINRKSYQIPSAWQELSAKQYFAVIELLHTIPDIYDLKLKLLKELSGIKWKVLALCTNVQLIHLYECIEFCLQKPETLTNHLPFIKIRPSLRGAKRRSNLLPISKQTLHGPASKFDSLTLHEFTFTEAAHKAFFNAKEEKYLDILIAILYRPSSRGRKAVATSHLLPEDFKGDFREKFNNHTIDQRIPIVAKLPYIKKMAIFYWYEACRTKLQQEYYMCFMGGGESRRGWEALLTQLAGGKFGDFETTKTARIKDVLLDIQIQKENEKRK